MTPEIIERINELARKAKSIGLTPEETAERDRLRKEYLAEFRRSFRENYLENMYIVDENGNKHKIEKKK